MAEIDRSGTIRVGVMAAVLWAAVALLVSALAPPEMRGYLALIFAPVALLIVGRLDSLRTLRAWIIAGAIAVGIVWVVGAALIAVVELTLSD